MHIRTKSIDCNIYSKKQLRENSIRIDDFNKLPNIVVKICGIDNTDTSTYHLTIHNTDISKGSLVDLSAALRKYNMVISTPFSNLEKALIDLSIDKQNPQRIQSSIVKDTLTIRLNPSFELFSFPEINALEYTGKEEDHVCATGGFKFCGKDYAFVIRYKPILPTEKVEHKELMKNISEFSLSKLFPVEKISDWIRDSIHNEFPFIKENYLIHAVTVY